MERDSKDRMVKRIERRYAKADKKLSEAKAKGDLEYEKANEKYGYNYKEAEKAGIEPDETGHWPSRNPDTGEILKGKKHPTMPLTKKGEKEAGFKLYRMGGKLYSKPK